MCWTNISLLPSGNLLCLQLVFSLSVWAQLNVTWGGNSERRIHYSRVCNLSEAIKINEFQRDRCRRLTQLNEQMHSHRQR